MQPYLFLPSMFVLVNPVAGSWQSSAEMPVHVGETLLRAINHRMVSSRYANVTRRTHEAEQILKDILQKTKVPI